MFIAHLSVTCHLYAAQRAVRFLSARDDTDRTESVWPDADKRAINMFNKCSPSFYWAAAVPVRLYVCVIVSCVALVSGRSQINFIVSIDFFFVFLQSPTIFHGVFCSLVNYTI